MGVGMQWPLLANGCWNCKWVLEWIGIHIVANRFWNGMASFSTCTVACGGEGNTHGFGMSAFTLKLGRWDVTAAGNAFPVSLGKKGSSETTQDATTTWIT